MKTLERSSWLLPSSQRTLLEKLTRNYTRGKLLDQCNPTWFPPKPNWLETKAVYFFLGLMLFWTAANWVMILWYILANGMAMVILSPTNMKWTITLGKSAPCSFAFKSNRVFSDVENIKWWLGPTSYLSYLFTADQKAMLERLTWNYTRGQILDACAKVNSASSGWSLNPLSGIENIQWLASCTNMSVCQNIQE